MVSGFFLVCVFVVRRRRIRRRWSEAKKEEEIEEVELVVFNRMNIV